MKSPIVATSAPGKLFLFGEYGVLTGGWCLVAAAEPRVVAWRRAEPRGYEALGAELDDASALPRSVLDVLDPPAASILLDELGSDVRQLFYQLEGHDRPEKLGLGSSAASAVALVAACLLEAERSDAVDRSIGEASRRRIVERAFAAHRKLQGGRGSGADVAASALGGHLAYRLHEASPGFVKCAPEDLSHPSTRLSFAKVYSCAALPVRVEPVWLGQPAVSTSFVRLCEEALTREPVAVNDALFETSRLAHRAIEAVLAADPERLLALVTRADQALEKLGELISAPIITDAHRALRSHANHSGLVVKPSGAGGGDFSLVFGHRDAPWEAFLQTLPAQVRHIPMRLGVEGVQRELDAPAPDSGRP